MREGRGVEGKCEEGWGEGGGAGGRGWGVGEAGLGKRRGEAMSGGWG